MEPGNKHKYLELLTTAGMLLSLSGCTGSNTETVPAAPPSDSAVSGFHVSGTKLLDKNNNEFVMRGINHPHSWYRDMDETAITAIAATGANCIRLVLSDGVQWSRDDADTISALIDMCEKNELVAIVEVHDATGYNDVDSLRTAADYWIEVKDALEGTEDRVILNIANEWIGGWDSRTWGSGYTEVIPKLREAGIKNTIMVDAAGWGQYGKSIADKGAQVFLSDPDANTMFSVHMYGSSGRNEKKITKNLRYASDQGLCVCVGEFGWKHSDGDVDEDFIMRYCTENDLGYLGWSWTGNSGGVEYLDITNAWDGSELTPEWGVNLIEGEYGIRATSKKCSVFGSEVKDKE